VVDPEPQARCVCSACNSGWMSNLETAFKGELMPLLSGRTLWLGRQSQTITARWAIKMAITTEALVSGGHEPCYSPESRERVRRGADPARVSVWLSRWDGFDAFSSVGTMNCSVPQQSKIYHGCVATFAVGDLLIQVLNLHVPCEEDSRSFVVGSRPGPWGRYLTRILPFGGVRNWPPPLRFFTAGSPSLESLVSRFGGDFGW
jgi:hypothetical protein